MAMVAGPRVLAAVGIVFLAACSQAAGTAGESPAPTSAASPPEESAAKDLATGAPSTARGFVIATVVTHDAKVKILSSAGGDLRVVVRKLDGTLVADGISLAQLRAQDPGLYTVVTSARAGYIDATLDHHHMN